jgi:hypothetical protein
MGRVRPYGRTPAFGKNGRKRDNLLRPATVRMHWAWVNRARITVYEALPQLTQTVRDFTGFTSQIMPI